MIEFIVITLVIISDQIVKVLSRIHLTKVPTVPLIKDVFHLTYAENTGAAFSFLSGKTFFLGIISLVSVAIFSYYLYKKRSEMTLFARLGLAMIIGGSFANMIDRFLLGYVVDMFEFRFINWAIFNVADSFITVGAILFIISVLFLEKEKKDEQM